MLLGNVYQRIQCIVAVLLELKLLLQLLELLLKLVYNSLLILDGNLRICLFYV